MKIALETYLLDDAPAYEALSYVWGSSYRVVEPPRLLVEGGDPIFLTENLEQALLHLRRERTDILIWIDAICINQADEKERAQQVVLMGDIYRQAKQVTVWLGPDTNTGSASIGIQALRYFVDCSSVEGEAPWYMNQSTKQFPGRSKRFSLPVNPSPSPAQALGEILQRGWWYRVWTVQEAVLARRTKMTCGQSSVYWETDVDTLRHIKYRVKSAVVSRRWTSGGFDSVDLSPLVEVVEAQLRERASEGKCSSGKDFLDIVYDFRHRISADPRDRFFGMLALAEGRRSGLLEIVDYSRTVEEVEEDLKRRIAASNPGIQVQSGI